MDQCRRWAIVLLAALLVLPAVRAVSSEAPWAAEGGLAASDSGDDGRVEEHPAPEENHLPTGSLLPTNGEEYAPSGSEPSVSAASAILIDAGSGLVLFEKDAQVRRPMASTTKIMTALLAIEEIELSKPVTVPKEAVGVEGSSVYLYENERLTMEELLYAMMLESANDAATAIAIETAGSIEAFAERMNRRAASLGLADTSFENPHGLDGESHYTTASDLARLTAAALENPTFRQIVSTYRKVIPMQNGEGSRLLLNHNRLLRSYDGAVGVKTGFTRRSGRCLVTAAERDGVLLIAVTLNAPDDWNDHRRMLDYGFSRVERIELIGEEGLSGLAAVVGGEAEAVPYSAEGPLSVDLIRQEHRFSTVIEMANFYYAPIEAGETLGRIVFYDGDVEIASAALRAAEGVAKRPERLTWLDRLKALFGR